jgi:hypothetical protein
MIGCTLGPLAKCGPRELIKVKVEDRTEWAIVGAKDPGYFPIIVLTGQSAPFVINVLPIRGDFETYPVAKYGTKYRLAHDPSGQSRIGNSPGAAGSLVLAGEDDWYLIVNKFRESGVRWFHLASGKVLGEPGSHRMTFDNWHLCIDGLKAEPSETILISCPGAL